MAEMTKASFWDMEDSLGSYLAEIAHSKPLSAAERRAILGRLREVSRFRQEQGMQDLESWVEGSPLVEVTFK